MSNPQLVLSQFKIQIALTTSLVIYRNIPNQTSHNTILRLITCKKIQCRITTLNGHILSNRTGLQEHALSIVTVVFSTTPSGDDELRHWKHLSKMCYRFEPVFGTLWIICFGIVVSPATLARGLCVQTILHHCHRWLRRQHRRLHRRRRRCRSPRNDEPQ